MDIQSSTPAGSILLVDDDAGIRRALCLSLGELGFSVEEARDGEGALAAAQRYAFDVVMLDMNMRGMGGMLACRELRRAHTTLPILILTVCDSEEEKVRAFEAGADDYILKPFELRDLVARVRAAVRRNRALLGVSTAIRIGEIELDSERRTLRKGGKPVHLTPKEFELLRCLMGSAGKPIPHAQLLRSVWGPEYGNELEYLRTFIRQLRLKIEDDPAGPVYLLTEAYVGYRFSEASAFAAS